MRLEPPIDRSRILDQCLDNLDFALSLLDDFAKTSPARLKEFDTALAEQNQTAIVTKAHALRGTAGILAIITLPEICSKLESAATNGDWNQTRELIQQLRDETQRIIEFIPMIRDPALPSSAQ